MKTNFFNFFASISSFYFLITDSRLINLEIKKGKINYPPVKKKTFIFLPYRFNYSTIWFEFLIAYYLKTIGHRVLILFAGKTITITDGINYKSRFPWIKEKVNISRAYAYSKKFKLDLIFFDDILSKNEIESLKKKSKELDIDQILSYNSKNGINHGRKVFESVCRYHGSSKIRDEEIVRKFFFNSLISEKASINSIERFNPDKLFTSHGVYTSWGTFSEIYHKKNIDFVCWGFQYRSNSIIAAHNRSTRDSIINENPENYSNIEVSEFVKKKVLDYVKYKIEGNLKYDRINYYSDKKKFNKIHRTIFLKRFCMFPNLEWDSIISFKPTIFENMNDWIIETVDWFIENPKYELVLRSHPAETNNHIKTQITVKEIIQSRFGTKLPKNISIIDSNSDITSYEVLLKSDICLVYGSKIGLEAAILNKPVFVCSKSHFYGKNLAIEPKSKLEYFQLLENEDIYNEEFNRNAIKYGYYYYFKRQFFLPLLKKEKFNFENNVDLDQGKIPNFDKFIRCVLHNENFINDEEIIRMYY